MRERRFDHALPEATDPGHRGTPPAWARSLRAAGAAVLAVLLLVAAPLAPAGAEVLHFRSKGAVLEAHATVRDGCTTRLVSVSAFAGFERGEYLINYADSRFPTCPGGEFSLAEGQGRGEVSTRGNLSLSRLVGSVPVTDIATGATETVRLDLTFTGVGPIERIHRVDTNFVDEDMPDVIRVIAQHGTSRSASVTGEPDLPWDSASVVVFHQFEYQRARR